MLKYTTFSTVINNDEILLIEWIIPLNIHFKKSIIQLMCITFQTMHPCTDMHQITHNTNPDPFHGCSVSAQRWQSRALCLCRQHWGIVTQPRRISTLITRTDAKQAWRMFCTVNLLVSFNIAEVLSSTSISTQSQVCFPTLSD